MGMADRDYHRGAARGGGNPSRLTPVVKWLLGVNIGVFFTDMFLDHAIREWGGFTIESAIFGLRVWEFVTFQFLHGSLGHLLFNCLGLFFFGPWMERWWGARRFLGFYLLCGCAGAVLFTLLTMAGLVPGGDSMLIGASAGIYGIFTGVAVIAPNLRVMLLFPPIEVSMRQLAVALLAISAGIILLEIGRNQGGEAGHLGGAVLGYILTRRPRWLGRGPGLSPHPGGAPYVSKLRPRSRVRPDQETAVDAILDKISREGFQSLCEAEREILRKAAARHTSDS
jgi:membrane associated rhomboid family serine protease